jgi:hypothetical protein
MRIGFMRTYDTKMHPEPMMTYKLCTDACLHLGHDSL